MTIITERSNSLPKSYVPADHEAAVLERWSAAGVGHAEPAGEGPGADERPPFCMLIPPPNVTAALHLGHAFNNTLQDVLARVHRMRGHRTLWMPGTDHAGIATQTVVEKRLLSEEGRRRTDFEREEFVERVQAWKDEYEATIVDQLRMMGASCDYGRLRFTMDPMCAKAVRAAFFRLFADGLIYRGKRLVNWDPVTQTALADDEVEMEEVDGRFYDLRYPLVHPPENPGDPADTEPVTWSELATRGYPVPADREHGDDEPAWVTVATTRPETYLGDTAVAVNPHDPRAAALEGLMVQLPLVGRVIPIVTDDYVVMPDPESSDARARNATGFLKVTPAHDPNDWDIGRRHGLAVINVMAPDGSISDRHGWEDVGDAHLFVGLAREDARAKVVAEFEQRDLLEGSRPHRHSVGHSYRSHVPIEPYLSDQWYVRVSDDRLVGEAQRALAPQQVDAEGIAPVPPRAKGAAASEGDGEIRFFPARYARTYQQWHANLRDWCISRQLWWGHRIPVWTLAIGEDADDDTASIIDRWRARADEAPDHVAVSVDEDHLHVCLGPGCETVERAAEADGLTRDPDVLDTWFSSGLWPLSTMGWPDPDADESTAGLLETFNPSSVLSTGREIITLWVSRMVMFNRYFNEGRVPFRHVYVHAIIQDGHGQKMSKSLGNGVDPRDIIHSHGADAMRFTLAQMATETQDVRLPVDVVSPFSGTTFAPKEITTPAGYRVADPLQTCPDTGKPMVSGYGAASGLARPSGEQPLARNTSSKFDLGRNFCNKIWNATRFALGSLPEDGGGDPSVRLGDLPPVDRWIVGRLVQTIETVDRSVEGYHFAALTETVYDFLWRDVCDWYLESIKPTVRDHAGQQQVLRTVLDAGLRLLHPLCPFVTEVLWTPVQGAGRAGLVGLSLDPGPMLATAAWPVADPAIVDEDAMASFERVQGLVHAINSVRGENRVKDRQRITLHGSPATLALVELGEGVVETRAGIETVQPLGDGRPARSVPLTFEGEEVVLSGLVDEVDVDAERARLEKVIADRSRAIAGFRAKLSNEGYLTKAPGHLVEETRRMLAEAEADVAAARSALDTLGG